MAPGVLVGVFGTDAEVKTALETVLAKKSEAEGMVVYHRTDSGMKISLLDDLSFPGRIQGYARIASLADYAFYVFPASGKLAPPDGELAVLLASLGVPGRVMLTNGSVGPDFVRSALRGTSVAEFPVEERSPSSSALDLSGIEPRDGPAGGTLVYIDRAFSVKGVGTVVLGFVLGGKVSVHDQLRPLPAPEGTTLDVKSIQVNDQDVETAERGIRVGLSLRGVDASALAKTHWLDDGRTALSARLRIKFSRSPFYRQELPGRELHLQLPGEMLPVSVEGGAGQGELSAVLPEKVPVWEGMGVAVVDLNGKGLRVAGGGKCSL